MRHDEACWIIMLNYQGESRLTMVNHYDSPKMSHDDSSPRVMGMLPDGTAWCITNWLEPVCNPWPQSVANWLQPVYDWHQMDTLTSFVVATGLMCLQPVLRSPGGAIMKRGRVLARCCHKRKLNLSHNCPFSGFPWKTKILLQKWTL